MGPNRSVALSVIIALVSAVGGVILWLLVSPVAVAPDFIGQCLQVAGTQAATQTLRLC